MTLILNQTYISSKLEVLRKSQSIWLFLSSIKVKFETKSRNKCKKVTNKFFAKYGQAGV